VTDYLKQQGLEEKVAAGVVNAFLPHKPTVAEIKALGKDGLKALTESVQREIKANNWSSRSIDIHIKVPHQKTEFTIKGPIGQTFYQLAKQNHDLGQYLECACSGVAVCSTCHVIVDETDFAKLPAPKEDEADMLDLASDVTPTSRLGCQIKFTEQLDGLTITIPASVNNLFK
jgi:2Fe-2S ferredoxin